MASTGHRSWRQVSTILAREARARIAPPLDELITRITELQDATAAISGSLAVMRREMAELHDIVAVQVDVGNQTTELFGRLLADASARLETLEEDLRQLTQNAAVPSATSNGGLEHQRRPEPAAAVRGIEEQS